MWLKLSILVDKFGNMPCKRFLKPNSICGIGAQKTNILNAASIEADPRLK